MGHLTCIWNRPRRCALLHSCPATFIGNPCTIVSASRWVRFLGSGHRIILTISASWGPRIHLTLCNLPQLHTTPPTTELLLQHTKLYLLRQQTFCFDNFTDMQNKNWDRSDKPRICLWQSIQTSNWKARVFMEGMQKTSCQQKFLVELWGCEPEYQYSTIQSFHIIHSTCHVLYWCRLFLGLLACRHPWIIWKLFARKGGNTSICTW